MRLTSFIMSLPSSLPSESSWPAGTDCSFHTFSNPCIYQLPAQFLPSTNTANTLTKVSLSCLFFFHYDSIMSEFLQAEVELIFLTYFNIYLNKYWIPTMCQTMDIFYSITCTRWKKRDKCPQGLNNYIFREEQESSLKIHRTNLFKFELSVAQMITQLYLWQNPYTYPKLNWGSHIPIHFWIEFLCLILRSYFSLSFRFSHTPFLEQHSLGKKYKDISILEACKVTFLDLIIAAHTRSIKHTYSRHAYCFLRD